MAMYQKYAVCGDIGRRPMRVVQIDDEEGRPCVTMKDKNER